MDHGAASYRRFLDGDDSGFAAAPLCKWTLRATRGFMRVLRHRGTCTCI